MLRDSRVVLASFAWMEKALHVRFFKKEILYKLVRPQRFDTFEDFESKFWNAKTIVLSSDLAIRHDFPTHIKYLAQAFSPNYNVKSDT